MMILNIILIVLGSLLGIYLLFKLKMIYDYFFTDKYDEVRSLVGEVVATTKYSQSYVYKTVIGEPSLVIICQVSYGGQITYYPTTVRKVKQLLSNQLDKS